MTKRDGGLMTAKLSKPMLLLIVFLSIVLAIPFALQTKNVSAIFDFSFNAYALLSALGVVALAVVIILLLRRQKKTFDNLWLIMGMVFLIAFGIGEILQRLSASPSAAVFWAQFSSIGVAFSPALLFLFALNYTRPDKPNAFISSFLLFGSSIIAFFHVNGGLIFKTNAEAINLYPWGYNNHFGPAYIANILWIVLLYALAIGMMFYFRKNAGNKVLKNQATIFMFAISVPLIGGIIFDTLLPLLGISMPPMAFALTSVYGVLVVMGVLRYQIFRFSPGILSHDILATMNESVIVTNTDLKVEFINKRAEKLLSRQPKETYGSLITELFDNAGSPDQFYKLLLTSDSSQESSAIEGLTMSHGNNKWYLQVLAAPIVQAEHTHGHIFVISDITELRQAYIDLENAKANIEQTVEERTKELREAQQQLLDMDKLKTEFITIVSHNLRTPLTIIDGYTSMLAESKLDDTQKKMVKDLQDGAQRLTSLVNELITINLIKSGDDEHGRQPVKISAILDDLITTAHEMAKKTGNKFTSEIEIGNESINTNPDRLKAAFSNIIDNAFKFTKNGSVKLTARILNESLLVSVEDNGAGIANEELPKLFTTFHRGTSLLDYNYEGVGIGLYLTKLVIDEHSGKIDIDSNKGKGTIVTISIPINGVKEKAELGS